MCFYLLVRQQTLELRYVGLVGEAFLAEVALKLGRLSMAVEQVALAYMAALELTVLGNGKSLLCTAVRFNLRHKGLLLSEFTRRTRFCLLILDGRQEHKHLTSFELGLLFHRAAFRAQLREAMEQFLTERRMCDLAAAEADRDLDLVAVL